MRLRTRPYLLVVVCGCGLVVEVVVAEVEVVVVVAGVVAVVEEVQAAAVAVVVVELALALALLRIAVVVVVVVVVLVSFLGPSSFRCFSARTLSYTMTPARPTPKMVQSLLQRFVQLENTPHAMRFNMPRQNALSHPWI